MENSAVDNHCYMNIVMNKMLQGLQKGQIFCQVGVPQTRKEKTLISSMIYMASFIYLFNFLKKWDYLKLFAGLETAKRLPTCSAISGHRNPEMIRCRPLIFLPVIVWWKTDSFLKRETNNWMRAHWTIPCWNAWYFMWIKRSREIWSIYLWSKD